MKVDAKHLRELMSKAAPLPWPGPGILRPTRGSDGITAPAAVWLEAPRHVTVDRSDLLHADDAELAVEAVNALPSLLAELDALREAATKGVAADSKISEPVPSIDLTQAIELIPVSEMAAATLKSRWP